MPSTSTWSPSPAHNWSEPWAPLPHHHVPQGQRQYGCGVVFRRAPVSGGILRTCIGFAERSHGQGQDWGVVPGSVPVRDAEQGFAGDGYSLCDASDFRRG
jgi:hypothetical protein